MVEVRKTGVSASPHSCGGQEAGALARPVEHRAAGRDRAAEQVAARVDHGDPGPGHAAAGRRGGSSRQTVAWPSADAGHVEHRCGRARWQQPDPDAKIRQRAASRACVTAARACLRTGAPVSLPVPVVWSEDCLRHEPGGEVWLGVCGAGHRGARAGAGAARRAGRGGRDGRRRRGARRRPCCRRCTTRRCVEHLATIWARLGGGRLRRRVRPGPGGALRVPHRRACSAGLPMREPAAVHARAGLFCYDTMTLVGPGSWAAITGAVDAALTAADLVAAGARLAYALCRPPGHHATRDALRRLLLPQQRRGRRAGAAGRRGAAGSRCSTSTRTTATAPRRSSTTGPTSATARCTSIRAPAGSRTTPGYADERGTGAGEGANRNLPLAPGTGDDGWLAALGELCARGAGAAPDAVVVSLGVDAAAADPESPLQVTAAATGGRQLHRRARRPPWRSRRAATTCRPWAARRGRAGRRPLGRARVWHRQAGLVAGRHREPRRSPAGVLLSALELRIGERQARVGDRNLRAALATRCRRGPCRPMQRIRGSGADHELRDERSRGASRTAGRQDAAARTSDRVYLQRCFRREDCRRIPQRSG